MINYKKMANTVMIKESDILKILPDLENIISWQEKLQSIDTKGVEPIFNTLFDMQDYISNKDKITEKETTTKDLMSNVPISNDNFILVPKVIKK